MFSFVIIAVHATAPKSQTIGKNQDLLTLFMNFN